MENEYIFKVGEPVEGLRSFERTGEIVRCKDCKHNSLKRMSGNTFCDLGMGLSQLYDFCSQGERSEE